MVAQAQAVPRSECSAGELTALTTAVVNRMDKMFRPYRGTWDHQSLVSHGLDFAREAVRTYRDDQGAQVSTWISIVVWRGLKTLHRGLERQRRRERDHGEASAYLRQGRDFEDVDDSLPVEELIAQVYRQAVHTAGRTPTGRGCRIYEPAQEAALLAIKKRLNLSNRGVISYLMDRPTVVSAIRLKRLPSRKKIDRLWDRFSPTLANKKAAGRSRSNRNMSAYITEKQAAELVGLSWMTLRRWRCKRQAKFTVYRPGGRVRYLKAEVVKWMESQAVRPEGVVDKVA